MPSFLRLPLLPLLAFAPACGGAVTSPSSSSPPSASADAGDAGTTPAPACTGVLTVGPARLLSGPDESERLQSITSRGPSALVGWIATSGAQVSRLLVRPVGLDGAATGPSQNVLAVAGSASLAQGLGRAAALGADATQSCQLVPLNDDGTTAGAAASQGTGGCESLRVTPAGFDLVLFASNPWTLSLVTAGPGGAPGTSSVLETAGLPVADVARASFDDGSFLLALEPESLDNCLCPVELTAQHFSANGASLAAAAKVGPILPGAHLAIAGLGSTALVATSGSVTGPVTLRPLDANGNAMGSPHTIGEPIDGGGPDVLGIDLAPFGDGAIVAWSELLPSQTDARLRVQAVSAAGAPLASPVVVASTGVGRDVRVVATTSGALVAWDGPLVTAQPDGTVSVAALGCAP